ncbi:hypothetical protein PSH76_08360 [Pseudomonas sp. FP215]|uniref:hypothetical protein n=1 Tax=unclassified Pseudomonas TaxID=196821 RepID=UPI0025A267F6|nr:MULTISPECIES: hypothetical protein [unclassified Pseudomonas]WLH25830.1 hypothetical protein PSH76_08360 [Pseudomonas sp. FP215]
MSTIEEQIAILTAPSAPAIEVVTMPRVLAEQSLAALEESGASASSILELRGILAEPALQLWAIHSPGPGEEYPCMDREDAERRAKEIRDCGEQMKAERIARGESVEMWSDWITNVVPSPWEPAEHFEIMAQEWMDDADNLRQHAIKLTAERDELLADLQKAASTLRRYEQAHRAKGTADSMTKAEVNAALALRFEATIAKSTT